MNIDQRLQERIQMMQRGQLPPAENGDIVLVEFLLEVLLILASLASFISIYLAKRHIPGDLLPLSASDEVQERIVKDFRTRSRRTRALFLAATLSLMLSGVVDAIRSAFAYAALQGRPVISTESQRTVEQLRTTADLFTKTVGLMALTLASLSIYWSRCQYLRITPAIVGLSYLTSVFVLYLSVLLHLSWPLPAFETLCVALLLITGGYHLTELKGAQFVVFVTMSLIFSAQGEQIVRALETTGASISLRAKHVERVAFVVAILLLPYATNPSQMQEVPHVNLDELVSEIAASETEDMCASEQATTTAQESSTKRRTRGNTQMAAKKKQ